MREIWLTVAAVLVLRITTCCGEQVTNNYKSVDSPKEDPKNYTVLLPFPGDCNKFYMCDHGRGVVKDCPGGLFFNANLSVCDWPWESGCTDAPTTPAPGWQCPPPDPEQPWRYMYPYPGNCTKFYMYDHGIAIVKDCPGGLFFNANLSVCDWPWESGCTDAPTTPAPGWQCPPPDPEQPWRYMYPYPGNCTKFYMCNHGIAIIKHCPRGLFFNANLSICDQPKESGCLNTPTTSAS